MLEVHSFFLFFDLNTFSNFLIFHLFSAKYFKQPTIDLTWFLKKDFDLNSISILPFAFFIVILLIFFIVFTFSVAICCSHCAKIMFYLIIFCSFFNNLISSLFLICHTLSYSIIGGAKRLIIKYS